MSVEFGIFPLTGILLATLLYGIYRLLIRMRCNPHTSQWYIVAAVGVSLLVTFMQPVTLIDRNAEKGSESEIQSSSPVVVENPNSDANITQTVVANTENTQTFEPIHETQPIINNDIINVEAVTVIRIVYIVGVIAMLLFFIIQIVWLVRIRQRSTHMEMENGVRVYDTDVPVPFSFGNSVFMPEGMEKQVRDDVFLHESKHLLHGHYRKLCLMQIMQAIGWFNPFIWLFTNEYKLQQEMEVDQDVMDSGRDREQYQMNLLKMCLKNNNWVQIMPAFSSSVIKRRILFMNHWKPSRTATIRMVTSFAVLILLLVTTAFATSSTKIDKCPIDGVWTTEWIRNTDQKEELVPSLAGNAFYGNDMMMNFTWFSRYNGVNMRFNFSGEPQIWRNGKIYDDNGNIMDIKLKDNGKKFLKRFKRTPKMTNLVDGSDVTEQWKRIEPDKDVLRILHALFTAGQDKSRNVYGIWQENIDTVQYLSNYFVTNKDIYARFTIWQEPDSYWCSAGGWCGDFRILADDRVFMSDRTSTVVWHDKDSMTLIIPRDSGILEPHIYYRSKLPDRFLRCLTAAEGYE